MAALSFTGRKRIRKSFGKIQEIAKMPNLIEVQKASYDQFLQMDTPAAERTDTGLEAVFRSVFPIKDFNETATLEYVKYEFEEPKYDVEECQQRGMTFAAPLKVTLRLIVFEVDQETGLRERPERRDVDGEAHGPPPQLRTPASRTADSATGVVPAGAAGGPGAAGDDA